MHYNSLVSFLKEQQFLNKQKEAMALAMSAITLENKKEIYSKEREFLNKKQQLLRGNVTPERAILHPTEMYTSVL